MSSEDIPTRIPVQRESIDTLHLEPSLAQRKEELDIYHLLQEKGPLFSLKNRGDGKFRRISRLVIVFYSFSEKKNLQFFMVSLRKQSVCGQPVSWKIRSKPHRGNPVKSFL